MTLGTDVGRFAIVPLWVAERLAGDPAALRLFILLAGKYADLDTGECFPKQETLAAALGVSDRTVRDAARALIQAEALTVERRGKTSGGGGRTSNLYRLHFAAPTYRKSGAPLTGSTVPVSPPDTSSSETEPPNERAAPSASAAPGAEQGGLWGQEERDRLQVMRDLIAERFRNRKGDRATRERLARLVRGGATVQQLQRAIEVAKSETRDDPVKYAVGILARMVEEGDDGSGGREAAGGGAGRGARGAGAGEGARGAGRDARGDGDRRGTALAGAGGATAYGNLW